MPRRLVYSLLAILTLSSADGSMYAFTHGPLRIMLVLVIDTFALILLLNTVRSRLEGRQIYRVGVHELLCSGDNVGD